jgi:outer membrane receptor for monomeric catechols
MRAVVRFPRLSTSIAALGLLLAVSPAAAQSPPPSADRPATASPAPPPSCTDCRAAEPRTPPPSTVIIEPDGKTIVPQGLMRQQPDFRLNNALKNVPGITGR